MSLPSECNLRHPQQSGIIQSQAKWNGIIKPPFDVKRKFSDQEIAIHAYKVSSIREIIQSSNSTPLKKNNSLTICAAVRDTFNSVNMSTYAFYQLHEGIWMK